MSDKKDPDGRQVFRSPGAVVVWWVWVLFAVGNLIDLAVQGRDHLSLVAAFILLFVTGIVYVTALRPRIIADADGLTIVNPVRDHRVGWAAVAGADPTDLLRVRCEWPDGDGTAPAGHLLLGGALLAAPAGRRRDARAAPVHGRAAAVARYRRLRRQAGMGGFGLAGGSAGAVPRGRPAPAWTPTRSSPRSPSAPSRHGWTRQARGRRRRSRPGTWLAVAAVVIPGLALLIAALA